MQRNEVINRLCKISTRVSREIYGHTRPATAFCGDMTDPDGYRFDSEVIEFIERAVQTAIESNEKQEASSEFKREPRYIVLKLSDMKKYLYECQITNIYSAGQLIANGRARDGRPPFNAVVVEQDWPEFEPTWAAIEARMNSQK